MPTPSAPRQPSRGGEEEGPPGIAKAGPWRYRRNLPHIQSTRRPIYVTFCTWDRWVLPEPVRDLVMKHCLHDHDRKCWIHAIIVMPDHVHLILRQYTDARGCMYGLVEILNGIKGASAHTINKALGRTGAVWQDESFDHVLRRDESLTAKIEYMWDNPVRKKLVTTRNEWRWFWADWMDGAKPV